MGLFSDFHIKKANDLEKENKKLKEKIVELEEQIARMKAVIMPPDEDEGMHFRKY